MVGERWTSHYLKLFLLHSKKAVLFLKIVLSPVQCFLKDLWNCTECISHFSFLPVEEKKIKQAIWSVHFRFDNALMCLKILNTIMAIECAGIFRQLGPNKKKSVMFFCRCHWNRSFQSHMLHHITHGITDQLKPWKNREQEVSIFYFKHWPV